MEEEIKQKGKAYVPLFFLMVFIVICIVIGYILLEQKDKSFTSTSMGMGVQVHQMICGSDAQEAVRKVKEKIEELENKISYDISESDIDRINSGAGEKWIKTSRETLDALDKFMSISKKSKMTLDPTVLPLVSIWGFDLNMVKNPDQEAITSAIENIDYREIKINYDVGRVKINNKNSSITLKQIEKGIACSAAIEIYKGLRIDYGVVSVGGTVGVFGEKPDNSLWKISVMDPFVWEKEDTRVAHLKIEDGYVSTFGLSLDKVNINGTQKNKILDIRTGYPPENDIALVSVIHSDAVVANALSQVCCILNKEESIEILNYYGAEAVFVYEDKSIYVTPNLKERFSIIDNSYILKQEDV